MRRVSVPSDRVAVIGAGASTLLVDLAALGYRSIDAVDISAAALAQLRQRLGASAGNVRLVCSDVRVVEFDSSVDVWHDRATFHFLTDAADQRSYARNAAAAVRAGGHLIIATFADNGPEQCSGLDVARYSVDALGAAFASDFDVVDATRFDHVTPTGAAQPFVHLVLRRRANA